jgi:uncharacterized protein YegL
VPKKKAEKKPSKKNKVLVNVVLDKSGSMGSVVTDTIGGFNTYKNELKDDDKVNYLLSLTLFDTNYENRHVAKGLPDVPDLTTKTYVPGGSTALYDAIGKCVKAVEDSSVTYDKVITLIMTDGQENSSREYKLDDVKALITRKEGEGNWTFVFLGADISAFAVGDAIGVSHLNSVAYSARNMGATYSNLATATMTVSASASGQSQNFLRSVPARRMAAAGMRNRAGIKPKR